MYVIALNYAVNPFGSLTYAWLMREMRFKSIAVMRFSAALVGALVSTGLAWAGYGPISLAFGSLASIVVNALLAVYFRPTSFPWMPGVGEIKRVLSFGSKVTGTSLVGVLSAGTPELLLGKLQDLTAVGLYSRATGLVQMFQRLFVDAVGVVCLPWFSRQSREQGGFVEPYIKATLYVSACGWSFCVVVICLAHPLMRFLYGTQWDQAVDLARLLAVATAFAVPAILGQVALLAAGAVAPMARLTVVCALQNVVFMAVGAYLGLWAMGFAAILSAIVASSLWLRTTSKHIGLSLFQLIPGMRQSALVALLAGAAPLAVLCIYGPYPEAVLAPLFLGGVGGLVGFVAGVFVFHHPLQEEFAALWLQVRQKLR
jgi:O-antigen/teichoic acid export membrane protein